MRGMLAGGAQNVTLSTNDGLQLGRGMLAGGAHGGACLFSKSEISHMYHKSLTSCLIHHNYFRFNPSFNVDVIVIDGR